MVGSISKIFFISGKWRWPMLGGISQVTLFVVRLHQSWPMHISSRCWSWTSHIIHDFCTSFSHYRAWTDCISLSMYITVIQRRAWIAWQHLIWPIPNGKPMLGVACTLWSANVRCGPPALPLACTKRSVYVKRGLPASSATYTHRSTNVECGLTTLFVACTH